MKKKERKEVFVALKMSGISGREKLSGIYRYLAERRVGASPWNVRLVRNKSELTRRAVEDAIAAGFDGFILSIPGTERATAPLGATSVPGVVMDVHSPELERRRKNLVTVHNSDESIGKLAADVLSSGGYRSVAFLHPEAPTDWSVERHRAFAAALAERGIWCQELGNLEDVAGLPRPAAVFAANDDRALELLYHVQARGLAVPDAIAVLGVDNDTMICEHSSPRLTSVEPDFEMEGYLAAKALDAMMEGGRPRSAATRITVPVKSVVTRDSLKIDSASVRLVQKALDFIERHATAGIGVRDVVAHLGCSRRLADLRFREIRGVSILEEITERRLDAVKTRLTLSRAKIDTISAECGYRDPNYLKTLFKKRFGCTMRAWRSRSAGAEDFSSAGFLPTR